MVSLTRFTLSTRITLILRVVWARFKVMSRYPGQWLFEFVMPTLIASMPILLGQAIGGGVAQASLNFARNAGTPNYVAYLLIGSNMFMLVSSAMWNIGFWLRREQQTGTLEALYLAPTGRGALVFGNSLYGTLRSLFNFAVAFTLGCLIFRVNPLQGDIALALAFLFVGLIPLYGIALLYSAMILKLKEANSLIRIAQWTVSFLMGLFFPIAVFPVWLRVVALAFPPTWLNNGVRASLLGVGYFFEQWYWDLAMLGVFCVIAPWIGFWLFAGVERGVKRGEGVGQF